MQVGLVLKFLAFLGYDVVFRLFVYADRLYSRCYAENSITDNDKFTLTFLRQRKCFRQLSSNEAVDLSIQGISILIALSTKFIPKVARYKCFYSL